MMLLLASDLCERNFEEFPALVADQKHCLERRKTVKPFLRELLVHYLLSGLLKFLGFAFLQRAVELDTLNSGMAEFIQWTSLHGGCNSAAHFQQAILVIERMPFSLSF